MPRKKLKPLELGTEFAEKYNPNCGCPFPFYKFTDEHKNITIALSDFEKMEEESNDNKIMGVTVCDKKKKTFKILIAKQLSQILQNFTIAHALGHCFLHKDVLEELKVIIDSELSLSEGNELFRLNIWDHKRMEKEANEFAMALLIPQEELEKNWRLSFHKVHICAAYFQVPEEVLMARLYQLKIVKKPKEGEK